jgi:hypothetical protein
MGKNSRHTKVPNTQKNQKKTAKEAAEKSFMFNKKNN